MTADEPLPNPEADVVAEKGAGADAAAEPAPVSKAVPITEPPPRRMLLASFKPGLRGAFFLRLKPEDIQATWSQLLILSLTGIALRFVPDFIQVGPGGEFSSFGLPGILFGLPLMLLAAWAFARLAGQREQTLLLAVAFCAIGLVIDGVGLLVQSDDGALTRFLGKSFNSMVRPWWIYRHFLLVVWLVLAIGVAAIRLLAIPVRRRFFAMVLAAMLIGFPLTKVFRNQTLWTEPYDAEAAIEQTQRNMLEREDIFYLQPKLLEQELAAVKPGPADRINLYFVGAAGYADQDVFMKEVLFVSKLFEDRYGTKDRSVELINNPKTAAEAPIASTTSLQLALERVGKVMDRDKDIVFLYLTSHGSKNHKFALDFGSMRFNDLDPPRLRHMLDKSGIKFRVVVISACYAGGFINALKNENTLVITAAAPDKTSFGCSNEADFTYFGKAYFEDALRLTDSFIDAFNLAKPLIAAREKSEQQTSSDPRMHVGAAIRTALGEYERQRFAARRKEAARR
ncbi:C13 family peptidase [soil metagenome]